MELAKRANRKGGFVWTIRWREGKTRRCKTLKHIQSEQAAQLALAEMINQRERALVGLPTDPRYSLREALDALLDSKRGLIGDKQLAQRKFIANRLCDIIGGNVPVARLGDREVGAVRQHLRAEGLSAFSVNLSLSVLAAAAKLASRRGIIGENPISDWARVSDKAAPAWRHLNEAEVARLMALVDKGYAVKKRSRSGNEYEAVQRVSPAMRHLIVFLMHTGARLGEGLAVRWSDVDFANRQVKLIGTKKASRGRKAQERFIPMTPTLRTLLERLHKERKPAGDDKVLTVSANNLRRKFLNLCERAGLGHVRIHDLRHTFCSHLAMKGVPIPTIQALAGHATIQMTMRYSHLLPGAASKAMEGLDFGLSPAVKKGKTAKVVDLAG